MGIYDAEKAAALAARAQGPDVVKTYHNHGQGQRLPAEATKLPAAVIFLTADAGDLAPGMIGYRDADGYWVLQYVMDGNGEPLASTNVDYVRARDVTRVHEIFT